MATKINKNQIIGEKIREHFTRNQSWLAIQIGMSEAHLSRKLNGIVEWTQEDLDKINKVLGTSFKLNN